MMFIKAHDEDQSKILSTFHLSFENNPTLVTLHNTIFHLHEASVLKRKMPISMGNSFFEMPNLVFCKTIPMILTTYCENFFEKNHRFFNHVTSLEWDIREVSTP